MALLFIGGRGKQAGEGREAKKVACFLGPARRRPCMAPRSISTSRKPHQANWGVDRCGGLCTYTAANAAERDRKVRNVISGGEPKRIGKNVVPNPRVVYKASEPSWRKPRGYFRASAGK
jgi:hypothetical protein